jgi:hypothetical protein
MRLVLRLLSVVAFAMIAVVGVASAADVDWTAPDWTKIKLSGVYLGQPAPAAVAALRAAYGAANVKVGRIGCIADVRAALAAKKTSVVPRCLMAASGQARDRSTIVHFVEVVPTRTSVVAGLEYSVNGLRTQADYDAFRAAVYGRYGPPVDVNKTWWCSTSDLDTTLKEQSCRAGGLQNFVGYVRDQSFIAPMPYGSCQAITKDNISLFFRYVWLTMGFGAATVHVADPLTYLTNCSKYNALYDATTTTKPDF